MARAGRKRDVNAARRKKTTRAARSPLDRGTEELQHKRQLMTGDKMVGHDFPLDVLFARRMISEEERDAGFRFAAISWRLFGSPHKGCDAIYQRMVAGGMDDFGPSPTAAEDEDAQKRRQRLRETHSRMVRLLQPAGTNRRLLGAVQNVAQHLRMPRYLLNFASKRDRVSDIREVADIIVALGMLADSEASARKAA